MDQIWPGSAEADMYQRAPYLTFQSSFSGQKLHHEKSLCFFIDSMS